MSPQHDFVIDNSTGANVRADINNVLQAIASNNSGSSAPSTTYALQFYADTTNNILKLRNAANDGFINLFTLAGGVDVDAASNFNEDVTFTTSNGNNLLFDKSDNALEFGDGVKALFGADSDLEIQHTGTHSVIKDAGTGNLQIAGSLVQLTNAAITESGLIFTENSSVELKFDNVLKLATVSGGVDISGDLIIDGAAGGTLTLGGSAAHTSKLVIASNDGSTNGNLLVEGGDGTDFFKILSNGNVRFEDNLGAYFGADSDLAVYYNSGSDRSIIASNGARLDLRSDSVHITSYDVGETMATFTDNGAVSLFFDNTVRAATVSNGFTVKNKLFLARETGTTADYANFRIAFYQSIAASSSHTFQVGSVHAMGTVQIFGSRGATANNATLATGKIFPIHVRSGATAGLGTQIGSDIGGASGGFSYTVAAASQGITITNGSSSFAMNTFVSFDLTGFVG